MKNILTILTILTIALSALLLPGFLGAQNVQIIRSETLPPGTAVVPVYTAETQAILQDRNARDRAADIEAALRIQSEADAQKVVNSILADANAAAIIADSNTRARIREEEAGRTEAARQESVQFLSRRLRGEVAITEAPASFQSRVVVEDPATGARVVRSAQPRYYGENRRVVTYRSMNEVPPILIASSRLDRVQVEQVSTSPYATTLVPVERRPLEYTAPEAYAVSYEVDPNSEVSWDDIIFAQGSTAFADAYSYDLVVDLAMAISDPALAGLNFVVEGHASSEGDYNLNLMLSQARAERIVREIVRYGVESTRLIPVGYGDTEATYPANAAENLRSTDRRVAVFRLK